VLLIKSEPNVQRQRQRQTKKGLEVVISSPVEFFFFLVKPCGIRTTYYASAGTNTRETVKGRKLKTKRGFKGKREGVSSHAPSLPIFFSSHPFYPSLYHHHPPTIKERQNGRDARERKRRTALGTRQTRLAAA
jgi:hypothetical protein